MDRRLFDQLDRLERGARVETRPNREGYAHGTAGYSAHEGYSVGYEEYNDGGYCGDDGGQEDPYATQPMTLDSFDERLLRQPDGRSRQEQALLGRTRMTLPPPEFPVPQYEYPAPHADPRSERWDLSQYAFGGQSSSSPFNQPVQSSPTFHASQRRPEPVGGYVRTERPQLRRPPPVEYEELPRYQPVTAEQIDAEMEEYGDENLDPIAQPRPATVPTKTQTAPKVVASSTTAPVVQGINLVPTSTLPDRFRALFPYPLFNAVQSKCFNTLYKTNDNFVLSAPTGSGKTAALELAICRLINDFAAGSYKIVYQAPTKSLCSERFRDWQAKFGPLDLQCAELTGDTDNVSQRNVQHASIIITTPEKWDSVTRKWKDQQKLMHMVKLFLIDEVHILKEDRGATLEAVVSRMKSVGSDVRFIALSATVPNSEDIATWLGKNPMSPSLPAPRERFGEEFRPVRLQKHVVGYPFNGNDFAFDKTLNQKLPEIIPKYSQRKPIMVFCFTRPACVETARTLSQWWASNGPRERYWSPPRGRIVVADKDLAETISSGVAFHHAGLTNQDRNAIEKGYLEGEINVICCTSTLAVGVNLPCHMVIIKNTVSYKSTGCKEYSDLEIMQMLGRAGRPQFDDSAVAVIMTKLPRVTYYEKMLTGQEVLESCLHRNLIDHLNAEIGLGTMTNASSAKKWLSGTFLYVRLRENPEHYRLDGDPSGRNLDEKLDTICTQGLARLEEHDLISRVPNLHCTEFGNAMARYYLQFDTMKIFLALPRRAKVSEILSSIAQAAEFKDVRFRIGEKQAYKDLNKNTSIKFPIPVTLDAPAHKISLIIQSVLGGVDLPSEDYKQRLEYNTSKVIIFNNVSRLIRCIIDCQLYLEDAVAARNALALARSLAAQVWDDSPLHIKQLDGLGPVYVRKLVGAGIKSIDDLESTEAHRIETVLSRNPPLGTQVLERAKAFPKLRVSIQMVGEPAIKKGEHVTIKLRAELGFLNDKVPLTFQRKPVFVCLLAETSDGRMIHFARMGAKKLEKGQDVLFSAHLTSASQSVRAYVMCDEVAGTARHARLKPDIPASAFPPPRPAEEKGSQKGQVLHAPNTAKRRASANRPAANAGKDDESDEFGDAGLDDADLAQAEADTFVDIDELDMTDPASKSTQPPKKKLKTTSTAPSGTQGTSTRQPTQLPNGKWACNHACKDKSQCRHLCCREGLDKPPKAPKPTQEKRGEAQNDPRQTQLGGLVTKKSGVPASMTGMTTAKIPPAPAKDAPAPGRKTEAREVRKLDHLHNSVKSKTPKVPVLGQGKAGKAPVAGGGGGQARLSFLEHDDSTDYGAGSTVFEGSDLPDVSTFTAGTRMDAPGERAAAGIADDEEMLDLPNNLEQDDGLGGGDADASSFSDDNSPQRREMNDKEVEDFFTDTSPAPAPRAKKGTEPHLFVGYSTSDSAANDLGVSQSRSQKHSPGGRNEGPAGQSSIGRQAEKSRPSSAQVREKTRRFDAALAANEFMGDEGDREMREGGVEREERVSSPDSLKKWVMEEFGTEGFNYTW